MYELGQESKAEHKGIVDFLSSNESMNCYFVGKDFYASKLPKANFFFYETFEDFAKVLPTLGWQNKTILIKGSRGMALERTLEAL
jgi:UDP-N-acetylmuramoyl-tripeptide--D-alanyl-D-alanine ligase